MNGGGAERVLSILANGWAQRGVQVVLITVSGAGHDAYVLDAGVVRIGLDLDAPSSNMVIALRNNLRRVVALRRTLRIQKPDVVLSFLTETNVLAVLAVRPLHTLVVVSERIDPRSDGLARVWRVLRGYAYRRASAAVMQTESAALWFRALAPRVPVCVIPNPLVLNEDSAPDGTTRRALADVGAHPFLLAVGRLAEQKGYDLLLAAFAALAPRFPAWRLVIAGQGPERERLGLQVAELGLPGRVLLAGFTHTPQVLMHHAAAYVMSSRYEGFPNALLEAMGCGLPCASFDCPTGPAALIEHEVNGLLVPPQDVPALTAALAALMGTPALRARLGTQARGVVGKYALDVILARWENVLAAAAERLKDRPNN